MVIRRVEFGGQGSDNSAGQISLSCRDQPVWLL